MKLGRICVFLLLGLVVGCGKNVKVQVQDEARSFGSATLDRDDVEVLALQETGSHVIAEVNIHTALKFRRGKDGKLSLEEVRIGDGRWENAEHILSALKEERTKTTNSMLNELGAALEKYRSARGEYPPAESFESLVDLLAPRYLRRVVRIDGWQNPFAYSATGGTSFDLRSSGADGKMFTDDDLVFRSR